MSQHLSKILLVEFVTVLDNSQMLVNRVVDEGRNPFRYQVWSNSVALTPQQADKIKVGLRKLFPAYISIDVDFISNVQRSQTTIQEENSIFVQLIYDTSIKIRPPMEYVDEKIADIIVTALWDGGLSNVSDK